MRSGDRLRLSCLDRTHGARSEFLVGIVNAKQKQGGGNARTLEWGSLGKLVQMRTLEAVSEHFFHMGVAELCVDAVKRMEIDPPLSHLRKGGCIAEAGHE